MLENYVDLLDLGYFELGEAFRELADANVWKRPAPGLLSVGELSGHIAYWEAVRLARDPSAEDEGGTWPPDLAKCRVTGPFLDGRFAYYPMTVANPPSEEHLAMTAEQVFQELRRVHGEAVEHLRTRNPDLDSPAPSIPPGSTWTWREYLKYLVFHVAYHTGQIYSARHLLGEETPDN